MLTVQEMLEIALRHATSMADAMVAACVAWSVETGVKLRGLVRCDARGRSHWGTERVTAGTGADAAGVVDGVDWERMVRGNKDSRWQHV